MPGSHAAALHRDLDAMRADIVTARTYRDYLRNIYTSLRIGWRIAKHGLWMGARGGQLLYRFAQLALIALRMYLVVYLVSLSGLANAMNVPHVNKAREYVRRASAAGPSLSYSIGGREMPPLRLPVLRGPLLSPALTKASVLLISFYVLFRSLPGLPSTFLESVRALSARMADFAKQPAANNSANKAAALMRNLRETIAEEVAAESSRTGKRPS